MKNRLYLLLVICIGISSVAHTQQTKRLLKNHIVSKALLSELMAKRACTAEIDLDLLSLSKTFSLELDLFEDVRYHVAFDRLDRRHPVGDVDVYWGSTGDPDWAHLSHYNDVILTVNRTNNKAMVYAMTSDGMFVVSPTAEKNRYLVYEATIIDWSSAGCLEDKKNLPLSLNDKQLMMAGCEEQDADGKYVVDMLFSYSHEAELALVDVVAHSVSQAETVNIGLANSLVTNTYLRVVDIAVEDNLLVYMLLHSLQT